MTDGLKTQSHVYLNKSLFVYTMNFTVWYEFYLRKLPYTELNNQNQPSINWFVSPLCVPFKLKSHHGLL